MSVITPHCTTSSGAIFPPEAASLQAMSRKHTFTRPVAPEANEARDHELLNLYFDGHSTTQDIAQHVQLPIAVVSEWLKRSDIAAAIDSIAFANERRARDVARAGLPGVVNTLIGVSRSRTDDQAACTACNTLLRIARGAASAALLRRSKSKRPLDGTCDLSTAARARRTGEARPRGTQTIRINHAARPASTRDDSITNTPAHKAPSLPAPASSSRPAETPSRADTPDTTANPSTITVRTEHAERTEPIELQAGCTSIAAQPHRSDVRLPQLRAPSAAVLSSSCHCRRIATAPPRCRAIA